MKLEVAISQELHHSLKTIPTTYALVCSVMFNEHIVGGVAITCSDTDLKFFGITQKKLPTPGLKFRMLNWDQKIFLIEIHLYFDKGRTMKLHLNPIDPTVRMLFKLMVEKQMISFTFYLKQADLIISCFTMLEEEDTAWIKRNYELMNRLKSNDQFDDVSYDLRLDDITDKKSRTFSFDGNKTVEESFISDGCNMVKIATEHL